MTQRAFPNDGPLRVAHRAVAPGMALSDLPARLRGEDWNMVELDVLEHGGRLVVAHDPGDLVGSAEPLDFGAALAALAACVGPSVRFDVDVKAMGYEPQVAAAIARAGIAERTLVSTMHLDSLRSLRGCAPELTLGLSVPLARRDYLGSRWTRPGAYAMLAYLRQTLPPRVGRVLDAGEADAIMAHWGVVTPRLVDAVRGRGGELFVWTVDDPRRLPALLALGVSGIITNQPGLFTRASADGDHP